MRILAAGGGSGGHVAPVVAVINELAKQADCDVLFVCDKAFEVQARGLMEQGTTVPVVVRTIMAGKNPIGGSASAPAAPARKAMSKTAWRADCDS